MAVQTKRQFYRRWTGATLTPSLRLTGIINLTIGTVITFVVWKWPAAGTRGTVLRWVVPTVAFVWFLLWQSARAAFELFHGVDQERGIAEDQLREKRDCQAIADYLTKEHHYGVHNLLHMPPANEAALPQWDEWVRNWNDGILHEMK